MDERPVSALEELLKELFDAAQLRRFLASLPNGRRLVDEIPTVPAPNAEVAHHSVGELLRFGRVDAHLFAELARARPAQASRVWEVARMWNISIEVKPKPTVSAYQPALSSSARAGVLASGAALLMILVASVMFRRGGFEAAPVEAIEASPAQFATTGTSDGEGAGAPPVVAPPVVAPPTVVESAPSPPSNSSSTRRSDAGIVARCEVLNKDYFHRCQLGEIFSTPSAVRRCRDKILEEAREIRDHHGSSSITAACSVPYESD